MGTRSGRALLVAGGTRFFLGKLRRVPRCQMRVDRPRHQPPGLMAELFDLCEGGFARRSVRASRGTNSSNFTFASDVRSRSSLLRNSPLSRLPQVKKPIILPRTRKGWR